MKKLMTMLLGLSFLTAATVVAQNAPKADDLTAIGKKKAAEAKATWAHWTSALLERTPKRLRPFEVSRSRLRRTRQPRVCAFNRVLVLEV